MGNSATSTDGSGLSSSNQEKTEKQRTVEHFVIKFIQAIPPQGYDSIPGQCNPFLRCFISTLSRVSSYSISDIGRHERISAVLTTPVRVDSKSTTVWNCYRNFFMSPPLDAYLTVEMMNDAVGDHGEMLGYVHIPISKVLDGSVLAVDLIMNPGKVSYFTVLQLKYLIWFLNTVIFFFNNARTLPRFERLQFNCSFNGFSSIKIRLVIKSYTF